MGTIVDVTLGEWGADAVRLDTLHRAVREELRGVGDLDVVPRPVAAPPGTRGLDVAAMSTLAVAVLGSGGLTALVASLRGWLAREPVGTRTVRLEIDGDVLVLNGASADDEQRLLDLFLRRHSGGTP